MSLHAPLEIVIVRGSAGDQIATCLWKRPSDGLGTVVNAEAQALGMAEEGYLRGLNRRYTEAQRYCSERLPNIESVRNTHVVLGSARGHGVNQPPRRLTS